MNWLLIAGAIAAAAAGWMTAGRTPVKPPEPLKPIVREGGGAANAGGELSALSKYPGFNLSSARLASLVTRFQKMPKASLVELRAAMEDWPAGTARMVLTAVMEEQIGDETPADHDAPDEYIEILVETLQKGEEPDSSQLSRWAALDPAAASEAVLQMKPGEDRTQAVDTVAQERAEADPAGALEFVLQSGERKWDEGAAQAWLNLTSKDAKAGNTVLQKMNAAQQATLQTALSAMISRGDAFDRMDDSEIEAVWSAARGMADGPEKQAMLLAFYRRESMPDALKWVQVQEGEFHPERNREQTAYLAANLERQAGMDPGQTVQRLSEMVTTPEARSAVLAAAAPAVLPQLCRNGQIAEAVQLLDGIQDAEAWRAGFDAVLPYWVDSDATTARAALDKAPLTGLEREKWLRQPCFLLNR